ncbi:MAG: flavin reductase family protein [Planctomycetota bacterium]
MLGRIPSGLFVVTWRAAEADRFMLASWVMQAGFSPPAITVAVGSSRDLLTAIATGTPFVVNILGESQRPLLARFGRPPVAGEDPFAGIEIVRGSSGAPAIAAATGWLECRGIAQAPSGDHTIVVAEVTDGRTGSAEPPLVHLRRNGLRY